MTMVIKVGGTALGKGLPLEVTGDILRLSKTEQIILVHGGGHQVTEMGEKFGVAQKFVKSPSGIRSRYTDDETIELYVMVVAGKINKEIVSCLQSHGVDAVGLTGFDGRLIEAERKSRIVVVDERGRRRIVEGGFSGTITGVNVGLLETLLANHYVPVVAPLAMGRQSEPLNVDADRVAGHVAAAVKARKLIFLTDVDGVKVNEQTASTLNIKQLTELSDKIGPGMSTKIQVAKQALENGIEEILITSGGSKSPIVTALEHQTGTRITK